MLSQTLFRMAREPGLHVLQRRGDRGARELTSRRLCLHAGAQAAYSSDGEETIVVLQQGRGTLATPTLTRTVSRTSVFAERATALCVPPGVPLTISADSDLEAILVSAPSSEPGTVAVVGPDDITINTRGRGIYTREVHDLFVRDPYAKRLMVGETFNPAGHWSSFPPHKHDGRNGEPRLEEVTSGSVDFQQARSSYR
jgi:5-deoxy-glucuronate isomerase